MAELSDVAVAFGLLNDSELNGLRIRIEPEPALKNGKARGELTQAGTRSPTQGPSTELIDAAVATEPDFQEKVRGAVLIGT